MAINFGGLATGLDTNAIIEKMMELQRQPVDRLQREKVYQNNRLAAFKSFDTKLKDLLAKVEALSTTDQVLANKATLGSEEYLGATVSASAVKGTYAIEVVSLAKQEKEVAAGVADGFTTAGGNLTINGKTVNVAVGSSLAQIRDAINGTAGIGAAASIINDGTGTPNRLVLTADQVGVNGVDITANTLELAFASQPGSQAHLKVDGIDIYRNTNTISDAMSGVTLDLVKGNLAGETTSLKVDTDQDAVKQKVKDFVKAYNEVFSFVKAQSDADWRSDSGFQSPLRRLRSLLTTAIGGSGAYRTLSALGLETQKDGTLSVNETKLTDAVSNKIADVSKLLVGEIGVEGSAAKFQAYLKGLTDSTNGILIAREKNTQSSVRRIDRNIESMTVRLDQKEANLLRQFNALEQLVSGMNSQSAFLGQQIAALNKY